MPLQRIFATPRWSSLRRFNASRHIATRSSPARPESWRVKFSMAPPTIFLWRRTVTGRSSWLIAAQQWPARNRSTRWENWACGGPGCQVPLHLALSLTWSRDRSALLIRLSRPMGRPLGTRWRGPRSIQRVWREGILRVDNINLVTGLVAQGHVSAGFVARSSLISGVRNGSVRVNESEVLWLAGDAALDQMMVLLTRGENNPAAQFWLDQMQTPSVRELIRRDGYRFPGEETDA